MMHAHGVPYEQEHNVCVEGACLGSAALVFPSG